jgi:hypothetical protein
MPHPCQNARALTVIGGHSGDVQSRGDLGSGCYWCGANKPDKEEVDGQARVQIAGNGSGASDPGVVSGSRAAGRLATLPAHINPGFPRQMSINAVAAASPIA